MLPISILSCCSQFSIIRGKTGCVPWCTDSEFSISIHSEGVLEKISVRPKHIFYRPRDDGKSLVSNTSAKFMWHNRNTSATAICYCHLICSLADGSQQGDTDVWLINRCIPVILQATWCSVRCIHKLIWNYVMSFSSIFYLHLRNHLCSDHLIVLLWYTL